MALERAGQIGKGSTDCLDLTLLNHEAAAPNNALNWTHKQRRSACCLCAGHTPHVKLQRIYGRQMMNKIPTAISLWVANS